MNKLVTVAVIAIGLSVFGAEPENQVNWKSTVSDGSYSLGTNWEGDVAPLTAGQTATFALGEATGAYTATIPAAGLTECAMTYLKAIGPTASLVLDATWTTWTKGAGAYAAADEAFRVTDTDGKTILNLSNVDTTGATDVFTLTDGKLSYDGATKTFSVDGETRTDLSLPSSEVIAMNRLAVAAIDCFAAHLHIEFVLYRLSVSRSHGIIMSI